MIATLPTKRPLTSTWPLPNESKIEARTVSPIVPKIASKTNGCENRPQDKAKIRPQGGSKNRPDIIIPDRFLGVVGDDGLKRLLKAKGLSDWCSRVRVQGLLLVIDYILRHLKNGTISISADLAHQYVSKLRKRSSTAIPTEPLAVLCQIGILSLWRKALFLHIQTSAKYRLGNSYRKKPFTIEVTLTPKLRAKREHAPERRERRLNRKFSFREQLLVDLKGISFAPQGRKLIGQRINAENSGNLIALIRAIDQPKHFVKVSVRGQITTSIGSCPRELQPHLLLYNEPTVSCDISNAHWNFLPLILAQRLGFVTDSPNRRDYINDGRREHNRLVAFLSSGDFYGKWCADPQNKHERSGKKTILNILLNNNNEDCERNRLYRKIRAVFPITFRIIEDIKRKDHRKLSIPLHRFTADAIERALLEVQRKGVAAIPHVDALICQQKHRAFVCEAVGRQVFEATGVCCTVGGIRYSPHSDAENQPI